MPSTEISAFMSYAKRRQQLMVLAGGAAIAGGGVVIAVRHVDPSLNILMGALVLVGFLLMAGTLPGRRLLREIAPVLQSQPKTMDMQTWGYRTIRSPITNRVLATFDDVGSTNRVPRFEVKATWFTPGIAERPHGEAHVYGGERRGDVLLATGTQGVVLGRISRVRPD